MSLKLNQRLLEFYKLNFLNALMVKDSSLQKTISPKNLFQIDSAKICRTHHQKDFSGFVGLHEK